ncbi:motility associated factor glycosyltransferase family protein [Gracilinema caldarium]|uniref:motility associated factor glycosyltransferase family protein n=1 Tax=Gracilinema caldarium TaxID=215591 RepID=UPI0026F29CE1|nr:6-hydroxymethylpterin diphosphokinase MptE-like protein [Gracilinema caldarium]
MNRAELFDRNLLALHLKAPDLCARLSNAETTLGFYNLVNSKSNLPVPFIKRERPLHSLFDPSKEAERLIATVQNSGFLILFGLGGGYHAQAALQRKDIQSIVIIDFNLNACAELLSLIDYVSILSDPRVTLIVDPNPEMLFNYIVSVYKPALHGGIQVIPLRSRVDADPEPFREAYETLQDCIHTISEDYSVQAYFGRPWFSNTVRNIFIAEKHSKAISMGRDVSVTAAGPSLEIQLPHLLQNRKKTYILATDTSLPALLEHGIEPDAVISIDCQHISYYHFLSGIPKHIPLFLDLSSPPVVASVSENTCFFSGGHPFTRYISEYWRPFPLVDTSGGNVTYAAVALANQLGASTITLYGADFSYPEGESYVRGTYIHKLFANKQDRLHPAESSFSAFLFRNILLTKVDSETSWRYETKPLISYRKKLETLANHLEAQLVIMEGKGAPISVPQKLHRSKRGLIKSVFTAGASHTTGSEFLHSYAKIVEKMPDLLVPLPQYMMQLSETERDVFTTLLPLAAFLRRKNPDIPLHMLFAKVKDMTLQQLSPFLSFSAK